MRLRRMTGVALFVTLLAAMPTSAERAPEDRADATHVVVGRVEGAYWRNDEFSRHYLVEIRVEKAEKGAGAGAGTILHAHCYLRNPDFVEPKPRNEREAKERLFRGSPYDGVPREGQRVRAFTRLRDGRHVGIYPSWYDVLK